MTLGDKPPSFYHRPHRRSPIFKGLAYLASANFVARLFPFLDNLFRALLAHEMVLIYSAHLDSRIILFFQGLFMLPLLLLGLLLFIGIERDSFNLVLYPTLTLLLLLLLRYGAEGALLIIHWEQYSMERGPTLLLYLIIDFTCIIFLLLFVYNDVAIPEDVIDGPEGLTPSRVNSIRRRLQRMSFLQLQQNRYQIGDDVHELLDMEAFRSQKRFANNVNGGSRGELITPTPSKPPMVVDAVKKNKRKPPAPPPMEPQEEVEEDANMEDEDEVVEVITLPPPRKPPVCPVTVAVEPPTPAVGEERFNYKVRRNKDHQNEGVEEGRRSPGGNRGSWVVTEVPLKDPESEEGNSNHLFKTQSIKVYESEPRRREISPPAGDNEDNPPDAPVTSPSGVVDETDLDAEEEKEAGKEEGEEEDGEWEWEYEEEEAEESKTQEPHPPEEEKKEVITGDDGEEKQANKSSYKVTAV